MKKILAMLACCAMALVASITSYAAKDETNTYEYDVRDRKAVLTKYATTSNATRVTVPDKVDGYQVIGLEGTFEQNQNVVEVILPDGIEFLGDDTFSRCRGLENVNIPDSVSRIGANCFEYTSIKTISIPKNLTEIYYSVFYHCENLENVNFGESAVSKIYTNAFGCCSSLKSIELPNTLKIIQESPFHLCDSLEELIIPESVEEIKILAYPIASGKNLKRIINKTNIEWDRGLYEDGSDTYYNAWFISEDGYETVNSLLPNSTIYRHKKDSSEKYVNSYIKAITDSKISMTDMNSESELLEYIKSIKPKTELETLSCEISISLLKKAQEGTEYNPNGVQGSAFVRLEASNSALEHDKYGSAITVYIEPIKYEKPDNPSSPNTPSQVGNEEKPSEDNTNTEKPDNNKPNTGGSSSDDNSGSSSGGGSGSGRPSSGGGSSSSGGSSGGGSSSGGGGGSSSGKSGNSSVAPGSGLTISNPSIIEGTWEQVDGRWKLKATDGSYTSSLWANLAGQWYLIGSDGFMLTNWQMVNGKWYLLGQDGAMLSGWQFVNGKWYYMEPSGEMVTGWKWVFDKCYYMDSTGDMLANTTTPDGYTVNENGEWVQ